MTLPDKDPARKARRWGLIVPWGIAALLVLAWSAGWYWLKDETIVRMDGARAAALKAGWRLDWQRRTITGFPFRLNVDLIKARWGEASGWSVTAPVLRCQAYVSAPTHWVMVAPAGAVLTRPAAGPITVGATVLRGSFSEFESHPPRVSIEGLDIRFKVANGGAPFWLSTARELHIHTKAGPGDRGALFFEVDQATTDAARYGGKYATFVYDVVYTHAGALRGRDWPSAVRSWRRSGGTLQVKAASPPRLPFVDSLLRLY